jgi:hypothetical protein
MATANPEPTRPSSSGAAWAALDEWMGRRITGNPRGISNDVEGAWEIFRARLAAKERIARHGDPAVESLRTRGYADLGVFYDTGLIERIRPGRAVETGRRTAAPVGALTRGPRPVPESIRFDGARARRALLRRPLQDKFQLVELPAPAT